MSDQRPTHVRFQRRVVKVLPPVMWTVELDCGHVSAVGQAKRPFTGDHAVCLICAGMDAAVERTRSGRSK